MLFFFFIISKRNVLSAAYRMRGIENLFDNGFRVRLQRATDNDESREGEIVL